MYKQKEYKIAESNLANFGTKMEHDIKEASAKMETAWHEAGKNVGILTWRIEKFHVVKSATDPGVFHENDSYIVLNTYKAENTLKFDVEDPFFQFFLDS